MTTLPVTEERLKKLKLLLLGFYETQILVEGAAIGFNMQYWHSLSMVAGIQPKGLREHIKKSQINECGTDCCLAGHVVCIEPLWEILSEEEKSSWGNLAQSMAPGVIENNWLFGSTWSNDPYHAVWRLYYYIKHKTVPPEFIEAEGITEYRNKNRTYPTITEKEVRELCQI